MTPSDAPVRKAHNEYSVSLTPGCGSCFRPALGSLLAAGTPAKAGFGKGRRADGKRTQANGAAEGVVWPSTEEDNKSSAASGSTLTRTGGSDPGSCVTPKVAVRFSHDGRLERHSSLPEVNGSPSGDLVLRHHMRGISAELFESGTTPMTAKSELRTFPTLKTPAPSTGVLRELEMEMLRAVRAGDPQRVAKLLASGCKPHPQVSPTAGFLLESTRPEISLLLLESGADVNAVRHSDGDTPLMLAVRGGDAKMVHLLLEYGANPSVRNRRNESPLILAAQLNKHDIYSLLIGRLTACLDRQHRTSGEQHACR